MRVRERRAGQFGTLPERYRAVTAFEYAAINYSTLKQHKLKWQQKSFGVCGVLKLLTGWVWAGWGGSESKSLPLIPLRFISIFILSSFFLVSILIRSTLAFRSLISCIFCLHSFCETAWYSVKIRLSLRTASRPNISSMAEIRICKGIQNSISKSMKHESATTVFELWTLSVHCLTGNRAHVDTDVQLFAGTRSLEDSRLALVSHSHSIKHLKVQPFSFLH